MSHTKHIIRNNQYFDSVFLMGINKRLLAEKGVIQSAVLMGSPANKQLLADIHVHHPEIDQAGANDLVVVVIAENEALAEQAVGKLDEFLAGSPQLNADIQLRTLADGLRSLPGVNLVSISLPGEYAAREARIALQNGLNLFIFSSNVSVQDELELKRNAREKGLLVMGPDCGTSIINGVGLGFANRVRRGTVGIIGPSGTGLQEITCLLHHLGLGISHAIGTGTRDLKDEIGGLTTLLALDLLEKNAATQAIAIVSKPVGQKSLAALVNRLENGSKPVVACFLGETQLPTAHRSLLQYSDTIDDAAEKIYLRLLGKSSPFADQVDQELVNREAQLFAPGQKYVRGLFAGGTFCYQSQHILKSSGFELYSNEPLDGVAQLPNPEQPLGHSLMDMGDELFTLGKPHPMIDGTMRSLRIRAEGHDPSVAILLLDFILGFNVSPDPVGEALDSILAAKSEAQSAGRHLTVVTSITGTEGDIQDIQLQRKLLEDAGVIVRPTNAAAARLCAAILTKLAG